MAMSQSIHPVSKCVPGYGASESRHFPHSAKSVAIFPLSLSSNRTILQFKSKSLKHASGARFFVCRASSSGPRRNSEFPKQNRQSFSRNRNRHNEEKNRFKNLDESDLLTSKNGPLLSLSNTPKFQATATPGPREREIVELFRKVQAKLRERSAVKEEKKVEAPKGKGKESETVDSLLKLLRKHSIEQGKKSVSNINGGGEYGLDQSEIETENEEKSTSYDDQKERSVIAQPNSGSFSRPPSNFRRKSPVPKVKFDSVFSSDDTGNSSSFVDLTVEEKKQPEFQLDKEQEPKSSSYLDDGVSNELLEEESLDTEKTDENNGEDLLEENEDLSSMKLAELRALAKTRGIKGYSKMKKGDLVELLSST